MSLLHPRTSSEAELAAFDKVCERLSGFDGSFSFERVDGLLCALAAGPRPLEPGDWLAALTGDVFERTFADPSSRDEALAALLARLAVLRDQLDPEFLFEQPEYLRLEPLMALWTDEERQQLVENGEIAAEDLALVQSGAEWAAGFLAAVEALPALWDVPQDDEAQAAFDAAFQQIDALLLPAGSDDYKAHIAKFYPDRDEPSRDDLIAEACMSVQDLRMYWVDFAPVTPTRRVEATPGRNDACPCGSGKKYKKCHGAN
jgi:uncharacterized protein